jgi:hypothetical protein
MKNRWHIPGVTTGKKLGAGMPIHPRGASSSAMASEISPRPWIVRMPRDLAAFTLTSPRTMAHARFRVTGLISACRSCRSACRMGCSRRRSPENPGR